MNDNIETSINHSAGYVWIEFKGHRREVFANPHEFPFRKGDIAVVEADRGEDSGLVRTVISKSLNRTPQSVAYSVIRRATIQDRERIDWLRERETEALKICRIKVSDHKLLMKLIDAEFRFDGLKLIFYFTADGRVDFRELVRDLAGTFRTRIELRQIGSRDEIKRMDSYGVCGYRLCCANFLNSFQPITTNMAKAQNLILNPSKLSGLCGKLKCCLSFEYQYYDQNLDGRPIVDVKDPCVREEDLDDISD